jgi:hypothetical protein
MPQKKKLQALFEVKSHGGALYTAGEVPIFQDNEVA